MIQQQSKTEKVPKSKNLPNFWSFGSYAFIFGEEGAYLRRKKNEKIFFDEKSIFSIENQDFEKIFFQTFSNFQDFENLEF